MKPTDLKLRQFDDELIRKIYMDVFIERHVCGGSETWFIVMMRYLEHRKIKLTEEEEEKKKKLPQSRGNKPQGS